MNGQMLEVFQHGVRRGRDEERAAARKFKRGEREMKPITVRLKHSSDLHVEAIVSVLTARPLVVIDSAADLVEDIDLTPAEAERLARALTKAAAAARAKRSK